MQELLNNIIFVLQKYFVGNKEGKDKFRKELARLIDAFGGCDKCFGRGYIDTDYTYCDCERGQQLEKVKNLITRSASSGQEK